MIPLILVFATRKRISSFICMFYLAAEKNKPTRRATFVFCGESLTGPHLPIGLFSASVREQNGCLTQINQQSKQKPFLRTEICLLLSSPKVSFSLYNVLHLSRPMKGLFPKRLVSFHTFLNASFLRPGRTSWESLVNLLQKKLFDTFVCICLIKSPQCTDKNRKKNSIAIFLPRVLMYQESNFTSVVIQNREAKNRRLGMIVTSFQEHFLIFF